MRVKNLQKKEVEKKVKEKKVSICLFCDNEIPYKEISDEYSSTVVEFCDDLCKLLWFYKDDRRDEPTTKRWLEEYIEKQKDNFIKKFIEETKKKVEEK